MRITRAYYYCRFCGAVLGREYAGRTSAKRFSAHCDHCDTERMFKRVMGSAHTFNTKTKAA